MSTWTHLLSVTRFHLSCGAAGVPSTCAGPSPEDPSADGLAVSVVRFHDVVAPATVRADHATERARPRLLLAMALAHQRGPGCRGEGAASGSTRKALVHLSLLSKKRAGRRGCQLPHVPFRVALFSHGAPPRRDEASARREGSRLHAAACWFRPFSDASVSEASALLSLPTALRSPVLLRPPMRSGAPSPHRWGLQSRPASRR